MTPCWSKDCQESLASWLCMTVECTVYSGPSHTSCLLRCWSLALICQRLSVIEIPLVTLMANQMLGKPVTPELATSIFRDTSFYQNDQVTSWVPFAAILWLHSLIKLWKAFGVNKNTVLLAVYRECRVSFPHVSGGQKDHRPGADGSDFLSSSKFNHFGSCMI